jgi:hypothetical protein
MRRLIIAAVLGFILGIAGWFMLATGIALLAPSNRLPRITDLANPQLLWPAGFGMTAAAVVFLIRAAIRRRLLHSN